MFSFPKTCSVSCKRWGANFGKLALLLDRHDWLRLIEPVSDEVMQLLPVIQLQGEETKLVFEPFIAAEN